MKEKNNLNTINGLNKMRTLIKCILFGHNYELVKNACAESNKRTWDAKICKTCKNTLREENKK